MRYLILLCFTAVLTTPPFVRAEPPDLALAGVYEEGVALDNYWVSEKLDGVRAYWDGDQFWSRGGHVYRAPGWFTEGFPDEPMDGELWMGRGRFDELSGAVRRAEPEDDSWWQIRFMVFDLPAVDRPFSGRIQVMESMLVPSPSPFLAMVAQGRATDHGNLMASLDEVVAAGGEGLMLRCGNSHHSAGRSDDLLKVKRYEDAEAVVVAHLPGSGKYQGMMGSVRVEGDDGRQFRIGTGFSDAQRKSPPPIGATITYKYYGFTSTGLPRFASFMRVRNDEPEAP